MNHAGGSSAHVQRCVHAYRRGKAGATRGVSGQTLAQAALAARSPEMPSGALLARVPGWIMANDATTISPWRLVGKTLWGWDLHRMPMRVQNIDSEERF